MSRLADDVLPLIRTRADLHRWSASNAHGRQMHEAIDMLEAGTVTAAPADVYAVTQKALASAIKVVARADDSSGIIGNACRRLLALHPEAASRAGVAPPKLVDWMISFQFDAEVDYFELDPVAYAPALGVDGLSRYRARLEEKAQQLGPLPSGVERWATPDSHARFVLEWNERRLAVLDRDVDAIIRTHARDRRVAAWLEDVAEALEEIGETDLAIDWAKQAVDFDRGHQALKASDRWCRLLAEHRPEDVVDARLHVFRTWPSSTSAARLLTAAGARWPDYREEVMASLGASPRDAVLFALLSLEEASYAWDLAHTLGLRDADVWLRLVQAYGEIEPLAVLPILAELVENELTEAGAQHYRIAARHLSRMRELASGTSKAAEIGYLIAQLRETHRRRPRLQQEFDRAGLP
jgi:hypothetical protein